MTAEQERAALAMIVGERAILRSQYYNTGRGMSPFSADAPTYETAKRQASERLNAYLIRPE